MKPFQKKLSNTLRQHNYRLTSQRQAVLEVLRKSQEHLTAAEVHLKVRQEQPTVGLVTVYRALNMLASLRLVCEVHIGGNERRYFFRRYAQHHHHLICSDCGAVVDFTDCNLGELKDRLCRETGFEIETHLLEFVGRCRSCQNAVST